MRSAHKVSPEREKRMNLKKPPDLTNGERNRFVLHTNCYRKLADHDLWCVSVAVIADPDIDTKGVCGFQQDMSAGGMATAHLYRA